MDLNDSSSFHPSLISSIYLFALLSRFILKDSIRNGESRTGAAPASSQIPYCQEQVEAEPQ